MLYVLLVGLLIVAAQVVRSMRHRLLRLEERAERSEWAIQGMIMAHCHARGHDALLSQQGRRTLGLSAYSIDKVCTDFDRFAEEFLGGSEEDQ